MSSGETNFSMTEQRFTELFGQYLRGTTTSEEWDELMQAVKHGSFDELLKEQIEFAIERNATSAEVESGKAQQILNSIFLSEKHTLGLIHDTNSKKSKGNSVVALAAAVLFVISVICAVLFNSHTTAVVTVVESKNTQKRSAGTEFSGKKYLHLPDGSTVILNQGSYLEFPVKFAKSKREVRLTGEGYFDIKHDALVPFIVYAGKIKTTVLGTAFNIKSDSTYNKVIITVTRGKVKVGDEKREYGIVLPNQQIAVDTHDNTYLKRTVVAATVVEWKKEYLLLDDVSMEEAKAVLENKFNIKILMANEALSKCRVTATFLNNENLEQVMSVICGVINASFTLQPNDQVVISGKGCD